MKINLKVTPAEKQAKNCILVGVYEQDGLTSTAKIIDRATHQTITKMIEQGIFTGKLGQIFSLISPGKSQFEHVVLVGFGRKNQATLQSYRKTISMLASSLRVQKVKVAVSYLAEIELKDKDLRDKVRQMVEAFFEGTYQFEHFKSSKEGPNPIEEILIAIDNEKALKSVQNALREGEAIGSAVSFTKNLANLPSNICTPTFFK